MRAVILVCAVALASVCKAATPQERFAWKEVDYTWNSPADKENAIKDGKFVAANNLPLGLARWKNKLFITVPRWKNGVASSLNYVDIDGAKDQLLKPYPSWQDNLVADTAKALPSNSSIISVFRVFVDACDRLWVMDTGLADILGSPNQVTGPSLVIFDLNTDKLLHRYYFKVEDMKEDSFFANVVCDSDLNILNMDASHGGADHDSFVWNHHPLQVHLEHLHQAENETVWFLGDSGYPLRRTLMTPVLDTEPDTPERYYTDLHCRVRNTVERCIGVLKSRWRCLLVDRKLHYHPTTAGYITNACVVLHNIANAARLPVPEIIPQEQQNEANMQVVDVNKNTCDDAFAYIPDLGGYGVVVYSLKQDDSWRVSHHYFHFDPLAGQYNVGGVEFQWTDGVFGLALSEPRENGYRTMFFHAFSSTKEFCVSTELLRNYTHLDKNEAFHDFKLLGDKGERTQASASYFDPKTQVLFYTEVNHDGVACWNSNKPFTVENNPLIISDPSYEFPNDLKVDDEGTLWFLTDKLPRFIYKGLDLNEVNHRIFSISTTDAIAGSACQP